MCRAGICGARCVAVSAGDASSAAAGQKTRCCASLKRAADQGDVEAQFALGTMHYKGVTVCHKISSVRQCCSSLLLTKAMPGRRSRQVDVRTIGWEASVWSEDRSNYRMGARYGVERFFLCCATPARGAGLVS